MFHDDQLHICDDCVVEGEKELGTVIGCDDEDPFEA